MRHQNLEVGKPLHVIVEWYDNIPEPRRKIEHEAEVIGWRDSQVIVRVKDYAIIRFWKKNGLEVGNGNYEKRGFRVDLSELSNSLKPDPADAGLDIPIDVPATDTEV